MYCRGLNQIHVKEVKLVPVILEQKLEYLPFYEKIFH